MLMQKYFFQVPWLTWRGHQNQMPYFLQLALSSCGTITWRLLHNYGPWMFILPTLPSRVSSNSTHSSHLWSWGLDLRPLVKFNGWISAEEIAIGDVATPDEIHWGLMTVHKICKNQFISFNQFYMEVVWSLVFTDVWANGCGFNHTSLYPAKSHLQPVVAHLNLQW